MLRGPADADLFRVKVGRYGDRWYADHLPACDLGAATDESWPSVSIVKNAWPKFLTNWAAGEAARFAVDNLSALANLDRQAGIDLVSKAHERSRDGAAARGTAVHALIEALSLGEAAPLQIVEAGDWSDAAHVLFRELRPEFLLSEAVAINRTLGYGGTLDGVVRINGKTYLVDWKSRKEGKHGAYDDEGAQLGAYAMAEYVIVERDGVPVRMRMPALDGALIVSIAPDGYRLYPIDLTHARDLFTALLRFWQAMQCHKPVGKPVLLYTPIADRAPAKKAAAKKTAAPKKPAPALLAVDDYTKPAEEVSSDLLNAPDNDTTRTELRRRVRRIIDAGHGETLARAWPAGLPTLADDTHTAAQLQTIGDLCARTERHHDMPFEFADTDASQFALAQALDPDLRAAIVNEAGEGRSLAQFTAEDTRRMRALIEGIDALTVAFTYEDDKPRLVNLAH